MKQFHFRVFITICNKIDRKIFDFFTFASTTYMCAYGNRAWAKLNVGSLVYSRYTIKTELTTKGKTRSEKNLILYTIIFIAQYTRFNGHDVSCIYCSGKIEFGFRVRVYICNIVIRVITMENENSIQTRAKSGRIVFGGEMKEKILSGKVSHWIRSWRRNKWRGIQREHETLWGMNLYEYLVIYEINNKHSTFFYFLLHIWFGYRNILWMLVRVSESRYLRLAKNPSCSLTLMSMRIENNLILFDQ